jgi:FkbM family methyltransferase
MKKIDLPQNTQSALEVLQFPQSPWQKNPQERAWMTIRCKDADMIPRVPEAGKVKNYQNNEIQIMHNGLKVLKNGYQGEWEAFVIERLKGVHEPQEEKVFYEVLKRLGKKSTMIELGSWWSYYSMWFLKELEGSRAYCTEPDPENIKLGKMNASINGFKEGESIFFRQYAAGRKDGSKLEFITEDKKKITVPIRSVDSIINEEKLKKVDLLHFDIQGAELDTLKGSVKSINEGKIRFLFISTHHYSISGNPNIHQECIDFIKKHGGHIISKHTVLESCSGDGLVVASFDDGDKDFKVEISRQSTDDSLFRPAEKDTLMLAEVFNSLQLSAHAKDTEIDRLNQLIVNKIEELNEKTIDLNKKIREQDDFIKTVTPLKKHIKKSLWAWLKFFDSKIISLLSGDQRYIAKQLHSSLKDVSIAEIQRYDSENYHRYIKSRDKNLAYKGYLFCRRKTVSVLKKVHAHRVRRLSSK